MEKLLFILATICLLAACNSKKSEEVTQPALVGIAKKNAINDILEDVGRYPPTVYKGILPCTNCRGIETILKIYEHAKLFELTSSYLGKELENKFVQRGDFNVEKGLGTNPDGMVYILNWDMPETYQIYYGYISTEPDKLFLLDSNCQIIDSEYSLTMSEIIEDAEDC
ncbi:copper resistance protein NlpE N-terminal domain-containing protein [Dysgonomonas sp. GY617]|uniref:copper resistance protein NlpE N-terminal domain-containing protein n=1 Tax=Dysgonomonas sp. GY617 TaxID=2780420 RepID=UPI0018837C40|nr:copper resistance protein NlpE N-terminal domain-containing protein [Dysgonomonas sp. GY617]MBF0575996.1 copper resistance protein NlpE N-terminal domain-containing protein [Dysgonomonas sp. GY617]